MSSDFNAAAIYRKRLDHLVAQLKTLHCTSNRLSNWRLLTFCIFLILGIVILKQGSTIGGVGAFTLGLGIFITLAIRHEKIISLIQGAQRLVKINQAGIARVDGDWKKFIDSGDEFIDANHSYSKDLDIFGQGSFFQWLNATGTYRGRRRLAAILSNERFDSAEAQRRRVAIEELAPMLDWRQNFAAQSLSSDAYRQDPLPIIAWMKDDSFLFRSAILRWFYHLFPFLAPCAAEIVFLVTGNPAGFVFWIPINIVILFFRRSAIERLLSRFDNHEPAMKLYTRLLSCMEKWAFQSDTLRKVSAIFFVNNLNATRAIAKLSSWVEISQARKGHMLGGILNALLLWDVQMAILLEHWKSKYGNHVEPWFDAIAEMEMLASLSTIRHDNPDWRYAEFSSNALCCKGENMGHPLIDNNKRIRNAIELGAAGSVIIITGSNMSGKTTLLRTIGVNLVLAYAGAPVCASSFLCATGQVLTSMRITDDLQTGISTFYAELLRIRKILDSLEACPSIVLIDEIFRGTNTHDRRQAAISVLRHLASSNVITVISTHDLDLADLENKNPSHYKNFHFEDTYDNKAIHFDYKLRPGRSTSSNAMHLLEIVGISTETNQ